LSISKSISGLQVVNMWVDTLQAMVDIPALNVRFVKWRRNWT